MALRGPSAFFIFEADRSLALVVDMLQELLGRGAPFLSVLNFIGKNDQCEHEGDTVGGDDSSWLGFVVEIGLGGKDLPVFVEDFCL